MDSRSSTIVIGIFRNLSINKVLSKSQPRWLISYLQIRDTCPQERGFESRPGQNFLDMIILFPERQAFKKCRRSLLEE